MKTLIVIPTYNEAETAPSLITRLLKIHHNIHILVVDDSSPDGTGDLIKALAAQNERIHLLSREKKLGIGSAYIAGFSWGIEKNFDYFIEMDADLSHRPRYIPKFLSALERHDVVIGSRWMKGGEILHWAIYRRLLSWLANFYVRIVLNVPIRDLTSGFTGWRREVLQTIGLHRVHSDGYSFQIEMKYRAFKNSFDCLEMPIQFPEKTPRKSKIGTRVMLTAFAIAWVLKYTNVHSYKP